MHVVTYKFIHTHTQSKSKRETENEGTERDGEVAGKKGREEKGTNRREKRGGEQKGKGRSRKKRGDGKEGGDKNGLMEKRKKRLREEGNLGVR